MKTTLRAAGGHWCHQSARDRAVTAGWNAHGAGLYPADNPWLTDQPEHYYWRDGWAGRNLMCARTGSDELILYVGVGRDLSRASAIRRSTTAATVRNAASPATGIPTGRAFAAATAEDSRGND